MAKRPYFIVVEWRLVKVNKNDAKYQWCYEFGDYERETAKQEMEDLKDKALRGTKRNFKLHKVEDASQKSIDNFMAKLNEGV